MNTKEQFLFLVHKLTEFALTNSGKCFGGWSQEKIFAYLGGKLIAGNLFHVTVKGEVKSIGIAQPTSEGRLFIGEVIGTRQHCRLMFKEVLSRWPEVKRFFAYRCVGDEKRLFELNPLAINKFTA